MLAVSISSFATAVVLAVLISCDQPNQRANTTSLLSVILTPTGVTTSALTFTRDANCLVFIPVTPNGDQSYFATREKGTDNCIDTKVALTHAPLDTPGPPPSIPPMPTLPRPQGIFDCDPESGSYYYAVSCWLGTVNGQQLSAKAGKEYGARSDDDPHQGMIVVYPGPNFKMSGDEQEYRTPIKVGAVMFTSVEGNRITVAQVDPSSPQTWTPLPGGATFVFDFATHQWVSWNCGISCTPTPAAGTPVMTLTP